MTAQSLAAAILDLHKPWYETHNGTRYEHRVYVSQDDLPEGHVCRIGGNALDLTCDGDDHYVEACTECRWVSEDGEPAFPIWPCPTALLAQAERVGAPTHSGDNEHDPCDHCLHDLTRHREDGCIECRCDVPS